MREQGDVWLGFSPEKIAALTRDAALTPLATAPMSAPAGFPDSHLPWQWLAAAKGVSRDRGSAAIQ
jgi:hypothetical protein